MKKVSLLVLVSMILLLAFTSCDMLPEPVVGTLENVKETVVGTFENVKDTVLGFLGIDTHEHVWNEATCESPKTCECGATDGEPLPHSWNEATCQAPKTCSVCGKTEGSALKHTWEQADCENPQTCKVCGETTGTAEGHFWIEATCDTAKYCLICNKVEGEALGHDWTEGDCTTPKTCKTCSVVGAPAPGHNWVAASCTDARTCETCGETDGEPLGHDWTEATCLTAKVCNRCELVEGEALGHKWLDATCETPKTCERCQLEEGEAIGHNYEATVVDPTCVNDGYTMHICANCNDTYTDTPVDALGHSWKDANCVDPKTCTVCGETDGEALGHTWVEATCLTAKTCSVCGETEGEVAGHVGGTATCTSLAKCDVCGEGYGEYDVHTVALSVVEGKPSYACTKCGNEFVPEEYHYFDGTGALPFTNASGDPSAFNGNTENGYYDFICKSETATNNQIQLWIPSNVAQPETLFGFSCENNAFGVFGFKIKPANFQGPIELILAERRNVSTFISWPEGSINALLIDKISEDNTVLIRGGVGESGTTGKYQDLVTVSLNENDGWIDIALFIDLNSDKTVSFIYFVNGVHVGTFTGNMTITAGYIRAAYIKTTMPNGVKDNGFAIDDIVFGYAANGHYTFDNAPHAIIEATCTEAKKCACGIVLGEALGHDFADATCLTAKTCKRCGLVEGDPLGHTFGSSVTEDAYIVNCTACEMSFALEEYRNFTGADKSDFVFNMNGAFNITVDENGQYAAIFKPEQDEIPADSDFEQKDGKPTGTYKGWAYYNAPGAQHMFWIPSNAGGKGLQGFDCEVNAVGVISFKIKTNVTTGYYVSIAKERNASDWTGWGTSEMKLLYIGEYTDNGVVVKGGINGSTEFTTIPVADGWSEMFDVKIFVELKDDSTITLHYYINNVFYGTFSAPMTIDTLDIRALYINGWTYAANTGIIIDDIVMGYTANYGSHLVFDGKDHKVTEATDCTTPAYCSCGWVGQPKAHNYSDATCSSNATCLDCGAIQGERKPHTLVYDGLNISCSVCNRSYKLEGIYADGTDVNNVAGAGNALFNIPNSNPEIVDGHYELIKTETTADPGQAQVWVPSTGGKGLPGFNTANGSVEGYFNFKVNAWVTKNFEMTFVDYSLGDNYDLNGDGEKESIRWSDAWRIGNSFFRISTPIVGEDKTTVEVKGFGGIVLKTITVADAEKPFTGWIDVRLQITLDAEKDVVRVTYYVDGEMCGEGEQPLTTLTNGICAIYINGNTAPAGSGYMLDDITFGYKADPHWTLDDKDHNVIEATCTEAKKCSCGYVLGEALGHDYKPTCTEDSACSRCGEVAKATGHSLKAFDYANGNLVFACANEGCSMSYNLTGYYADGSDYHCMNGSSHNLNNGYSPNGEPVIVDGHYELIGTTDAGGQCELTLPSNGHDHGKLEGLEAAYGATGIFSFKMDIWAPSGVEFLQFTDSRVRKIPGASFWTDGALPRALKISKPTLEGEKYFVTITGWDNLPLAKVEVADEKSFTGWIDYTIIINFEGDNVSLTYYINGVNKGTVTKTNNVITKALDTAYFSGNYPAVGAGVKFDDFVLGFTVPTYVDGKLNTTEIAAENVQSAALKAIVASKIKQVDQANPAPEGDNTYGYFVKEGGTPVFVNAFKNNSAVEALYFSRSKDWTTYEGNSQNSGWSEFRFDTDKAANMLTISFDYIVSGTTGSSAEESDDGIGALGTSYVQLKDSTGAYIDLADSALTIDGEWHTMTLSLGEGQNVANVLVKLYHFQGEMLISNLVITYAE